MKGISFIGRTWWFRGRINGKLIQVNLHTEDEAEAIIKARDVRVSEQIDAITGESFARALDVFIAHKKGLGNSAKHLKDQRLRIENAQKHGGWQTVKDATRKQVEEWADSKDNPRTRLQSLEIVSRFFAWCVATRRVLRNPCADVRRPTKVKKAIRKRFLTPEEAERLLATPCPADLKFALFCALHAGLRRGEVCAARAEWFDLDAGLLHVTADEGWQAKSGDNRAIPLTSRFIEFLRGYGLHRPYMMRPKKKPGKHQYRVEFRKPFEQHLKDCGISGICFHDLRRTFASLHVSSGTSVFVLSKWLGDHVNVVQDHYGHLHHNREDIERAWK
jgi:integrase